MVLAREGAKVVVADRDLVGRRRDRGADRGRGLRGERAAVRRDERGRRGRGDGAALQRLGRLDILHNNVGASIALGDAPATDLTEEAFDRSFAVNLRGMWLACKHAMPAMREPGGAIVNISSLAAVGTTRCSATRR